jgi:hypothetical protein
LKYSDTGFLKRVLHSLFAKSVICQESRNAPSSLKFSGFPVLSFT